MSGAEEDKEATKSGRRVFMSPAFLTPMKEAKGYYGLWRSIEIEETDQRTNETVREKLRDVGPIRVFRELRAGEERPIAIQTFDTQTNKLLKLVDVTGEPV
jgi:hypothetical protein